MAVARASGIDFRNQGRIPRYVLATIRRFQRPPCRSVSKVRHRKPKPQEKVEFRESSLHRRVRDVMTRAW